MRSYRWLSLAAVPLAVACVAVEERDDHVITPPTPSSSCRFESIPDFADGHSGCRIVSGEVDLGNFGVACPTSCDQEAELCEFALGVLHPGFRDGEPWEVGRDEPADDTFPNGFGYPNPDDVDWTGPEPAYVGPVRPGAYPDPDDPTADYWDPTDLPPHDASVFFAVGARPQSAIDFTRANEFNDPMDTTGRNVVVLGSSMMATHNQTQNGAMCSRASTRADRRGLIGNDFEASPGWRTRLPWRKALALGRTGYASGDVIAAPGNDACDNRWQAPLPPAAMGRWWLGRVGVGRGLMVTEGGIINDQQSRVGGVAKGWSETLGALVTCQLMDAGVGSLNILLAAQHGVQNAPRPGRSPTVELVRWAPPNRRWTEVLDVNATEPNGRCLYRVVPGAGANPDGTIAALRGLRQEIPPLIRLWDGVAANHPVRVAVQTIKGMYSQIGAKQVWLQYPYMDRAQVVLRANDLKLVLGAAVPLLANALGGNLTIDAIDPALRPRIRQVTDDLNGLMYDAIGCTAVAAFAPGHPARVCERDAQMKPLVVVTRDAFAGWAAGDHQTTIKGGMPHESAAGANKLGAALVAADALP